MVVGPGEHVGAAEVLLHGFRDLGPEAELVHDVGEGVAALDGGVEVVVQVVNVHVAVAEAAAGRDVEIAHDFVDAEVAFDAAALLALRV